jgi:cytochrome c553
MWTLALVVLPVHCQDRDNAVPPIAIYYGLQQQAPPDVLRAVQQEVDAIMSPLLPRFEWRSLDSVRGGEVSEELAVVKFLGACDVADLMPRTRVPGALGKTHVTDNVVLPFCDIDCDRIRGYLRLDLLTLPAGKREPAYARAVGRVLAHELYHIFARTRHHDQSGVSRAAFTNRELMSENFRFTEGASRPLRVFLAGARVPMAAGRTLYTNTCAACHGDKGEGTGRNPLLRLAGRPWDFVRLATQLGRKHTKMSQEAKHRGLEWPLDDQEMSSLVGYLNSLED